MPRAGELLDPGIEDVAGAGNVREHRSGARGRDVRRAELALEEKDGHLGARDGIARAVAAAGAAAGDALVEKRLDEAIELVVGRHVGEALAEVEHPRVRKAEVQSLLELRVPVLDRPDGRVRYRDRVAVERRSAALGLSRRDRFVQGLIVVDRVVGAGGPGEERRRPRHGENVRRGVVDPGGLHELRLSRLEHPVAKRGSSVRRVADRRHLGRIHDDLRRRAAPGLAPLDVVCRARPAGEDDDERTVVRERGACAKLEAGRDLVDDELRAHGLAADVVQPRPDGGGFAPSKPPGARCAR